MAAAARLLRSSILPKRIWGRAEARGKEKEEVFSILAWLLRGRPGRSAGNGLHDLRGQTEAHVLGHDLDFLHVIEALGAQELHHFFYQALRSRSARRQRDGLHSFQPLRPDVAEA